MTEFAHAVNFTMSFGVTVIPDQINELRKKLKAGEYELTLFNLTVDANSTDEQLANFIGLEHYDYHLLSECVDMEMEEHHVYNSKDTERLTKEYQENLRLLIEINQKRRRR